MCVQEEEKLKSEQPDDAHVAMTGPCKGKGNEKKFGEGNMQGNKSASVTKTDKFVGGKPLQITFAESLKTMNGNDVVPKTCEDYQIEREKVLRLCIAEGFVEYNKIKKPQPSHTVKPTTCQMHDLVPELAISMSEAEKSSVMYNGEGRNEEMEKQRKQVGTHTIYNETPITIASGWGMEKVGCPNAAVPLGANISPNAAVPLEANIFSKRRRYWRHRLLLDDFDLQCLQWSSSCTLWPFCLSSVPSSLLSFSWGFNCWGCYILFLINSTTRIKVKDVQNYMVQNPLTIT
ncbi:hypothetical protein RJ639_011610 [Escallonia herrerae]|uniref:Uncharacterized protein n=1 Tax=Escallonia herrerae TaxID=1293975 RepID=A0AA88VJ46_9ASTE|nr:hypothetical protein RJ639_011610 [Escallonia herrerae]